MLPRMKAMELVRQSEPFDDPDWIFEVKFDGFRALAYIENGTCELVSRKGNTYTRFAELRDAVPGDVRAGSAVLDGEILCLDERGASKFDDPDVRQGNSLLLRLRPALA